MTRGRFGGRGCAPFAPPLGPALVRENLKFLLKEFQFIMPLINCWSMAYTVYHDSIPMMKQFCRHSN